MLASTSPRRTRTTPSPRTRTRRSTTPVSAQGNPDRERLLAEHIGLVHHVARQLARRLSTAAQLDELVSAGTMGLIQAVDTFDTSRGLSFSTYAVPRIRGAILDELRRQDHVPRNVRRRSRDMSRARDILAARLRRAPTHDELSHVLHVPADTVRRWELDAEGASVCSLDQPIRAEESDVTLAETFHDDRDRGIEDVLTHEREVERMKGAIAALKEQERTVLALNYFEELKLQDIATMMNLSVCRISQIRTAALEKLRVALSDLRAA